MIHDEVIFLYQLTVQKSVHAMISFQIPPALSQSWFSNVHFTEEETESLRDEWKPQPELDPKTSSQSSSILIEK